MVWLTSMHDMTLVNANLPSAIVVNNVGPASTPRFSWKAMRTDCVQHRHASLRWHQSTRWTRGAVPSGELVFWQTVCSLPFVVN